MTAEKRDIRPRKKQKNEKKDGSMAGWLAASLGMHATDLIKFYVPNEEEIIIIIIIFWTFGFIPSGGRGN